MLLTEYNCFKSQVWMKQADLSEPLLRDLFCNELATEMINILWGKYHAYFKMEKSFKRLKLSV